MHEFVVKISQLIFLSTKTDQPFSIQKETDLVTSDQQQVNS